MWTPFPPTQSESVELTIGIVAHDDGDGVRSTVQALRLYQDLSETELLVIDLRGSESTQRLVEDWVGGRYVSATAPTDAPTSRDLLFREARGESVLCCDSGALLVSGAIARLAQYYRDHPDSLDLLQGPLLYDDLELVATNLDPVWRDQTWGVWALDPRGLNSENEPFEIPMQSLAVFSCRKRAWPGLRPRLRGFRGEEGILHEVFRRVGRRCLCLPWLRWVYPTGQPERVNAGVEAEEKLRNYVLGYDELELDIAPVLRAFSSVMPEEHMLATVETARAEERADLARHADKPPVVSVVMPVFNGERHFRQAVRSRPRPVEPPGGGALGGRVLPEGVNAPMILFHFHAELDVCRQRLQQLRKYNPDIPIYGLFGGSRDDYETASRKLALHLEHVYLDRHEGASWKWLHTDISLKEWYRELGHDLAFDYLYLYEYDLATYAPLPELYPPVHSKTLYFSKVNILTPELKQRWMWTSRGPHKSFFERFSLYMHATFGLRAPDTAALAPAPLLTRAFIDAFAKTEDIDWVHNEISLPAYARALGFTLADNGFFPGERHGAHARYFHCARHSIEDGAIIEELRKPWGRRIFHPVKQVLPVV